MNVASIDIGSNTVLLLIASIKNGQLLPILNRYETPRLGKELVIGGTILNDRIDHLLSILNNYKVIIEEYECEKTILTATNALRIASNSEKILEKVKDETGYGIKIISGDEEAILSFLGASSSFENLNEKFVIDIGGGSTEIIYGNKKEILYKHSFQTGVVSLTEKYIGRFPYTEKSLENTNCHLREVFNELSSFVPKNKPTIAVAGTPTTLSCIKQNLKVYSEEKVESSVLSSGDLNNLQNELKLLSGDQIKLKFGEVVNGREDVIFAGTTILEFLRNELGANRINVSNRGLRYGNIIRYASDLKV